MKLLLTKHGNVAEKEESDIVLGTLPGTLSANGRDQAERLAYRLKDEPLDAIYSSDLARSADTASVIARYHPHTPLNFTAALRERHLGEFQGKSKQAVDWRQDSPRFAHPPGGESLMELRERVERFLDNIFIKHRGRAILLVGHGDTNLAIVAVITNKPTASMLEITPQPNASLTVFEIDGNKNCRIALLNNTDHLLNL